MPVHHDLLAARSGTFSGAKKKDLLQAKREKARLKRADPEHPARESFPIANESHDENGDGSDEEVPHAEAERSSPVIVTSFGGSGDLAQARLSSLFEREDDATVSARRDRGSLPFATREKCSVPEDIFSPRHLPHPVRPDWSTGISSKDLDCRELAYFQEWCEETWTRVRVSSSGGLDVAPFELNLEVWRQLWRVLEQSDIVCLVTDVRNPSFHIPPLLVQEVTVTRGLRLVIVLNKVDLVAPEFVGRWRRHLETRFPDVTIVEFCSRPFGDPPGGARGKGTVSTRRRWLGRCCERVDLENHLDSMAKAFLAAALHFDKRASERQELTMGGEAAAANGAAARETYTELPLPESTRAGKGPGGSLSIGLVGHPNVGKTSVLNALAGRRAASVSSTAGHTKHLQHIKVRESLCPDAYVIDCPGLVFPSSCSRAEAELNGVLPLTQVRERLSAIRIVGGKLPLPQVYDLKLPEAYVDEFYCDAVKNNKVQRHSRCRKVNRSEPDATQGVTEPPWTPLAVLEAYADKYKYVLPRGGAPDVQRAGHEIMKHVNSGALLITYEPPGCA